MKQNIGTTILGGIDPDLANRLVTSRRGLFTKTAISLGALASAPLVLAAASRQAFAQGLPQEIVDTLNFALTLEHLEDTFYRKGLANEALIPAEYRDVFQHIGLHEAQHVASWKGRSAARPWRGRRSTSPPAGNMATCSRISTRS